MSGRGKSIKRKSNRANPVPLDKFVIYPHVIAIVLNDRINFRIYTSRCEYMEETRWVDGIEIVNIKSR